jgi:hemerythrin-like domain-containing protein
MMAGVFDVLGKDHAEVKQMLADFESGGSAGPGTGEQALTARKKLAEQLVIEESKHEAMEEMYFWPAVREKVSGGSELADTAIAQEDEGKQVLDKLDKADAGDAEFEQLLNTFIKAAREHIEFEETQVWPRLRSALSAEEAEELGTKIAEGKKTAPTRPHPHTPASPGVLKTAGPAAAATDRMRDAASGRGE